MIQNYTWDVDDEGTYNNKMGRYKTKIESAFINKYATKTCNVLDVGGGSGRFAIPLYKKGHSVLVIDQHESALVNLATKEPGLRCLKLDVAQSDFDLKNEKFDLIIMIEVLVYIENWDEVFLKIREVLDNDGVFIFTVTNKNSWRTKLRTYLNKSKKNPSDTFTELSISEYKSIINRTDFDIIELKGFNWIPAKLSSNSIVVTIGVFMEKILFLKYFIGQSPWIIYAIRKKKNKN